MFGYTLLFVGVCMAVVGVWFLTVVRDGFRALPIIAALLLACFTAVAFWGAHACIKGDGVCSAKCKQLGMTQAESVHRTGWDASYAICECTDSTNVVHAFKVGM
jgi:hypothetical protein